MGTYLFEGGRTGLMAVTAWLLDGLRKWRRAGGKGAAIALCSGLLFLCVGGTLLREGELTEREIPHALVAASLLQPPGDYGQREWLPLMLNPYNGLFKTYLLLLPFGIFGVGAETLRGASLSLGGMTVVVLVSLGIRLYGPKWGIFFGLLIATDPAMLLGTLRDYVKGGGGEIILFCQSAAFLLLAGWFREGRWNSRILGAGFLLGLALWTKAHVLWLIFALLGSCLVFWDRLYPRLTSRNLALGLVGLIVGSIAFIVFNIWHPLATFNHTDSKRWAWTVLGGNPTYWIVTRWQYLVQGLTGAGTYKLALESSPPAAIYFTLAFEAMAFLVLGAGLVRNGGWRAIRHFVFWASLTLLIFFAACVTPYPVGPHHFNLAYPFHHFALFGLLSAHERSRAGPRTGEILKGGLFPWVIPIFAACLLCQVYVIAAFRSEIRESRDPLYVGEVSMIGQWLKKYSKAHSGVHVLAPGVLINPLRITSGGRLRFEELELRPAFADYTWNIILRPHELLRWPHLILIQPLEKGVMEIDPRSRGAVVLERIAVFCKPPETRCEGAFRLRFPLHEAFFDAVLLLKVGNLEAARKAIERGLGFWEGVSRKRAPASPGTPHVRGLEAEISPGPISLISDWLARIPSGDRAALLAVLDDYSGSISDFSELKLENFDPQ